jgi:hypothetical protein
VAKRTLRLSSGPGAGQEIEIERELVVGREGCDVTIDDSELSRRHAAFRPAENGVEVEDLGSLNGTFVDGERISGTRVVTLTAKIKLGTSEGSLELAAADVTRAAAVIKPDEGDVAAPDVTAPRAIPEPEVTAKRPIPEPDVTAKRPIPEPDVTAKRPIADPDVTAPRAIPEPEVTAKRAIPEPDVTAKRPIPQPDVTAKRDVPPPGATAKRPTAEQGPSEGPPVPLIVGIVAAIVLIVLIVLLA